MENCIFCSIAQGKIVKEFLYEDGDIMVFPDIKPVKPVHLLIIPKKHIQEFYTVSDTEIFEKLGKAVQNMIGEMGLEHKGYRITVNGGGAQVVDHLHIHLLGPISKDQSV